MPRRQHVLLIIPIGLNTIISFSAFWTDLAYSYTAANQFVRGPLGYSSQISVCFYLTILIFVTISQLRSRNRLESLIMIVTSLLVTSAMVIEAIWLIRSIGRTAIVLSTMFYYMFFQTQEYQSWFDEETRVHAQLAQQARTDLLTGLLNKTAFLLSFNQAINGLQEKNFALIFFDLDRFKSLNDTLGHQIGDQALRDVAETMRSIFRKEDLLGRFGGDEFCVLLKDISTDRLSQKLRELNMALHHTYTKYGNEVLVTASIGAVVIGPDTTADTARILEAADASAYAAKKGGGDSYRVVFL